MTDQFLRGSSSRSRRSPIYAAPDNKTGSRRYEGARRLIQAAALGGRLVKRLRTAAAPPTGAGRQPGSSPRRAGAGRSWGNLALFRTAANYMGEFTLPRMLQAIGRLVSADMTFTIV